MFYMLLLVGTLLYASDQFKQFKPSLTLFEKCMSSTPVYWYSTYIVGPIINKAQPISSELASEKYQKLGRFAQDKMGIAENRKVPIKKMTKEYALLHQIQACAQPDAIYVYEDNLEELNESYQSESMLHEAFHQKCNHSAFPFLLLPLVGACVFLDAPMKFLIPKVVSETGRVGRTLLNVCLVYWSTKKIIKESNRSFEQRADTHALLHLDCYECVEEVAMTRKHGNAMLIGERGYLTSDEIRQFAQPYKKMNKLCDYHKNI